MTIAATRSGKVEGVERDGVLVFRGIPFAAPPVGPRRFRPPVHEDAWDGTVESQAFDIELPSKVPPRDGHANSSRHAQEASAVT